MLTAFHLFHHYEWCGSVEAFRFPPSSLPAVCLACLLAATKAEDCNTKLETLLREMRQLEPLLPPMDGVFPLGKRPDTKEVRACVRHAKPSDSSYRSPCFEVRPRTARRYSVQVPLCRKRIFSTRIAVFLQFFVRLPSFLACCPPHSPVISTKVINLEYKLLLSRGFDLEMVHPMEHVAALLALTRAPIEV